VGAVRSKLECALERDMRAMKLPEPESEYAFATAIGRRWRFDFAWPQDKVAVEVMGGLWNGGKHARGKGIERDYEKLNAAQLMGWLVLHVSPGHINSGQAVRWIAEALGRA
jgi:very-short-patch-repair endonuclease